MEKIKGNRKKRSAVCSSTQLLPCLSQIIEYSSYLLLFSPYGIICATDQHLLQFCAWMCMCIYKQHIQYNISSGYKLNLYVYISTVYFLLALKKWEMWLQKLPELKNWGLMIIPLNWNLWGLFEVSDFFLYHLSHTNK